VGEFQARGRSSPRFYCARTARLRGCFRWVKPRGAGVHLGCFISPMGSFGRRTRQRNGWRVQGAARGKPVLGVRGSREYVRGFRSRIRSSRSRVSSRSVWRWRRWVEPKRRRAGGVQRSMLRAQAPGGEGARGWASLGQSVPNAGGGLGGGWAFAGDACAGVGGRQNAHSPLDLAGRG
jgi:hypothetical protein